MHKTHIKYDGELSGVFRALRRCFAQGDVGLSVGQVGHIKTDHRGYNVWQLIGC